MSVETEICREVYTEIKRSDKLHGPQRDLPLGCSEAFVHAADAAKARTDAGAKNGTLTWMDIACEEAMECFAETDLDKIRAEAIQASAMFAKIALACDHQKEVVNPLQPKTRVLCPDHGRGTVEKIEPDSNLGPVAWVRWDNGRGVLPCDLGFVQKLERI